MNWNFRSSVCMYLTESEPESSQLCQNAKAKAKHSLRLESELGSCVKVEVAVLGSPSLIMVSDGFCGRQATLKRLESHVKITRRQL